MSEDMSHLINQINQMIENNQIPENIKNMVGQLKQNSNNETKKNPNGNRNNNNNGHGNGYGNGSGNNGNTSNNNNNNSNNNSNNNGNNNGNTDNITGNSQNASSEIDIETIMKMKKIIDSMNNCENDPRTNLLLSLKPYLKESRKNKVDQYIQIFKIEKVLETLGPLGGESKNDIS